MSKQNKMKTFLSYRIYIYLKWDDKKINKIKCGAIENMITDGVNGITP